MAKRFVLVTNKKHRGGYSVAVNNGDLEAFKKNPVMLWMHQRDSSWREDRILPIGRWQNLKLENDELTAESDFDMEDEFAAQIGGKVERGYLNAASSGLKVHEVVYVKNAQGEDEVVISKWELIEASIVDIPMDGDCTTQFYVLDENEKLKGLKNLDELKQAFPAPSATLINQNIDNRMEATQFNELLQAVKEAITTAQSLKTDIEAMKADLDTLKQRNEARPEAPLIPTPAPSIAAVLQQAAPQVTEEKKDFNWYVKNNKTDELAEMKRNDLIAYQKLCADAGVLLQAAQ